MTKQDGIAEFSGFNQLQKDAVRERIYKNIYDYFRQFDGDLTTHKITETDLMTILEEGQYGKVTKPTEPLLPEEPYEWKKYYDSPPTAKASGGTR